MIPIPLGLYIHIPWCVRKCPYCDFNSHQVKNEGFPEKDYLAALLADLESDLPAIWGRSIESVFIGGGTPSLFSAKSIDTLLSGLRQRLPMRPSTEITLEANPGTFEQQRFSAYREAGVNRLSIGIQSFNKHHLQELGRIHGRSEAIQAAAIARNAGFDNFNLDLMHGLPQQSTEQALSDLSVAIAQQPSHISWYQLTIEKNTRFHHAPPLLPDDDTLWEIQQRGQALLSHAGYAQYEVSAYSKVHSSQKKFPQERACRHNLNYWQFGDYIGIGAGAHAKITTPHGTIERHQKFRHPAEYLQKVRQGKPRSSSQILSDKDTIFEFMLNALRLKQGFSADLFEQRTLLPFSRVEPTINNAINKKLIVNTTQGQYRASTTGWLFLNDVIAMFL